MPFITQGKTNIKYIFIVIILAAIVGGGILGYLWVIKQETPPEIIPALAKCPLWHKMIEKEFEEANFCEKNVDCKAIALGGPYVEFGCYKFVNVATDENKLLQKVEAYDKECGPLIDRCAPAPEAKCVSNKCVPVEKTEDETANWEIYQRLLPARAQIIDVQPIATEGIFNRALVLWMINPEKHPKTDEIYTCHDYARGSFYRGPTRASLVDTKEMKIINTVNIVLGEDSVDISYKIQKDMWYKFYYPLREIEGATDTIEIVPKIMWLFDYNGDGKDLEFALVQVGACMGYATALIGYNEKQDKVIIYPIVTNGKIDYWADYLFYEKPKEKGYWKYDIDYSGRGGCLEKHEVRYNKEKETFEQTLIRICSER